MKIIDPQSIRIASSGKELVPVFQQTFFTIICGDAPTELVTVQITGTACQVYERIMSFLLMILCGAYANVIFFKWADQSGLWCEKSVDVAGTLTCIQTASRKRTLGMKLSSKISSDNQNLYTQTPIAFMILKTIFCLSYSIKETRN